MSSCTSLIPTAWPAKTVLKLILSPAATGDDDDAIVERIVDVGKALIFGTCLIQLEQAGRLVLRLGIGIERIQPGHPQSATAKTVAQAPVGMTVFRYCGKAHRIRPSRQAGGGKGRLDKRYNLFRCVNGN
jgi:hypothetical protein